jgi:pyruvate,water dikinase
VSRLVLRPGESGPPELVGGKACGLQQLSRLGLKVPRWITVTTAAVATPDMPWSPRLGRALDCGLERLGTGRDVAVRSSAVGEDSSSNSYAGQLRTILNVDPRNVAAAVRDCWASAFAGRAVLYRQARGLDATPLRMAVVIQEMVDARVSGVAVTADPITGVPALIVTAGQGLGEGVVTDAVETQTYRRDLGVEQWQVEAGAGRILSDHELAVLAAALQRIDQAAGCPQDVEWAFDRAGTLWLLQARPLTTIPGGELAIWDDSNIGESYPGLTQPLTASFVRLAYERLFGRALRLAGAPRRRVEGAQPILANLVGSIRGRLYFNLVNYYRLFLLIPGLERTVSKWETALGITHHIDPTTLARRPRWARIWNGLLAVRTAGCVAFRLFRLQADVRRFHASAAALLRSYGQADFSVAPVEESWRAFQRIVREFLDDWVVLILNDFFAFVLNDQVARLCRDIGGVRLHQQLLVRKVELHSLAPLQSVLALVNAARAEPAVMALLRSKRSAQEVWEDLGRTGAAFRRHAERHLLLHGERTIDELKLETPSLTETPWVIVSVVRNHLDFVAPLDDRRGGLDGAFVDRELARRLQGHPLKLMYARWLVRWTRRAIADRESMSYARARAYGVLRRLFRAMGEALARTGVLRQPRDIFYLTLEDLEAGRGLGDLVERRKSEYERYAAETPPPHRIVCRGPVSVDHLTPVHSPAAEAGANGVLRGVPCSPGRVRGIARVLHSPSPGERIDGEILIAPVTDPGWIFLMLGAAGLVVERGSILSHTAILGRELDLPTVVGAERATQRIASGDEIEIDGGTGEIRLLRRALAG